jgi:transcriptional regulator with XRE-family HTH domain
MRMNAAEWFQERTRGLDNDPEYLLEEVKLAFAEELCRLLEEQGISRTQLAERLGTSRAYVTRILRTDYNLTAETMVKVALALDARVTLSLQSRRTAPPTAIAVPARVAHRRTRRNEFVASDKPARPRTRKP